MTSIIVGAARMAVRVTASFAVAFTIGTLGHQLPARAAVTSPTSHTSLWWDGRTCDAFWGYLRHDTAGRLGDLYRDSRHADPYLRSDVGELHRVVLRHASRTVVATWRGYVALDCTTTADGE